MSLAICVMLCLLVGFQASQATLAGLQGWYQTIEKPAWSLQAWIFAPLWNVIAIFMGSALWLIWKADSTSRSKALILFAFNLVFFGAWSWIFFVFRQPLWALICAVISSLALILTIAAARKIKYVPALLFGCLIWGIYSSALSYSVWKSADLPPNAASDDIHISLDSDLPNQN
ncbi:MAG TPA: TspO/MBR family protein [Fimbriimonadaceae bacterium]|nr:TspO/MBR family protein [Fimbriimonadaceae bacterium]